MHYIPTRYCYCSAYLLLFVVVDVVLDGNVLVDVVSVDASSVEFYWPKEFQVCLLHLYFQLPTQVDLITLSYALL